jgi:hypothetical protein
MSHQDVPDQVVIAAERDTAEDCSLDSETMPALDFHSALTALSSTEAPPKPIDQGSKRDSTILPPPSSANIPDPDQPVLDAIAKIGDGLEAVANAIRQHTLMSVSAARATAEAAALRHEDEVRRTDALEMATNLFRDYMERVIPRL